MLCNDGVVVCWLLGQNKIRLKYYRSSYVVRLVWCWWCKIIARWIWLNSWRCWHVLRVWVWIFHRLCGLFLQCSRILKNRYFKRCIVCFEESLWTTCNSIMNELNFYWMNCICVWPNFEVIISFCLNSAQYSCYCK